MEAVLITYTATKLSRNEASKLSKALIGYKDKSNKARYTYKRKGLVGNKNHLIIAKSTFIVTKKESKKILDCIKNKGGTARFWNLKIPKKTLQK